MFKASGVIVALWLASPAPAIAQAPAPAPAKKAPAKKVAKGAPSAAEVAALSGTDVEAAAKAAEAIGANGSPAAHEVLLDALALGLPDTVATPAIVGLAKHPAPPDVPALVRYANHVNPTVRNAAITALAQYPAPAAHKAIVARLGDQVALVRGVAAGAAAQGRVKAAIEPLLVLLSRGEEPAGKALALMADPDLARRIAEQLGKVPEASLAQCLGWILVRPDFGPDTARVEVVRAIGKLQDKAAVGALQDYLAKSPKTPARSSRTEAQMIVDARLGGGT